VNRESTIFFIHLRSVIIIYLSFVLLITGKITSFTGKRYFSRLHSMSKDGMSRDGRKMSPMHVTLKAGVIYYVVVVHWEGWRNKSSQTLFTIPPPLMCPPRSPLREFWSSGFIRKPDFNYRLARNTRHGYQRSVFYHPDDPVKSFGFYWRYKNWILAKHEWREAKHGDLSFSSSKHQTAFEKDKMHMRVRK